jgi:hypothetical protein
MHDELRHYIVEHLGESQAVLVIDKTAFLKQAATRQSWLSSTVAVCLPQLYTLCGPLTMQWTGCVHVRGF